MFPESLNLTTTELSVFSLCFCSRSASTTPSGSPRSSQQSVYTAGEVGTQAATPITQAGAQPSWNPFGDDNFSKLTAEELLNKDFAKLDGKITVGLIRKIDDSEWFALDQVAHVVVCGCVYSKSTREVLYREPDLRFTTCSPKQRPSPVYRYIPSSFTLYALFLLCDSEDSFLPLFCPILVLCSLPILSSV